MQRSKIYKQPSLESHDVDNCNLADNTSNFDDEINFLQAKKKNKVKQKKIDNDETNTMQKYNEIRPFSFNMDHDYTYEDLLKLIFKNPLEKTSDYMCAHKIKLNLRPPQMVRFGSKKTTFVNFMETARTLHRPHKHLLEFLVAELGTSGAIDGNHQLNIKGHFNSIQMESVLRRYIKEYVTCTACHSPETLLQKEKRSYFLHCEKCNSRCSVPGIKTGFQAVTVKRVALRAKTT